jgi:hypothetical protein
VGKSIKEMRDEKATGNDGVPGDFLKLLGEDGLKIMTQLINNTCLKMRVAQNSIEVIMTALKKKPNAT